MKVKKNDTVLVITGKDAGKTAKVLVALPKDNKVVVDGVNVQKKHKKARTAQEVSSIVNQSGAKLAGCSIAIEKGYQGGGDKLRAQGIKVESLAIIEEMNDTTGKIVFRK